MMSSRRLRRGVFLRPSIGRQPSSGGLERLRVLKAIKIETLRRNEVASRIASLHVKNAIAAHSTEGLAFYVDEERQLRAATVLKDVSYVIEARSS